MESVVLCTYFVLGKMDGCGGRVSDVGCWRLAWFELASFGLTALTRSSISNRSPPTFLILRHPSVYPSLMQLPIHPLSNYLSIPYPPPINHHPSHLSPTPISPPITHLKPTSQKQANTITTPPHSNLHSSIKLSKQNNRLLASHLARPLRCEMMHTQRKRKSRYKR